MLWSNPGRSTYSNILLASVFINISTCFYFANWFCFRVTSQQIAPFFSLYSKEIYFFVKPQLHNRNNLINLKNIKISTLKTFNLKVRQKYSQFINNDICQLIPLLFICRPIYSYSIPPTVQCYACTVYFSYWSHV